MKMNWTGFVKLMLAVLMAFAAIALSACQSKVDTEATPAIPFPPLTPVTIYDTSG